MKKGQLNTQALKLAGLMTIVELTEMLGVSRPTIYRWVKDPAMNFPAPVNIGRRIGWRKKEIEGWLKAISG